MALGLRRVALLLALFPLPTLAQPIVPLLQPLLRQTTPDGYRAHLEALRRLVLACRENASLCNPTAVGEDDKVAAPSDAFQIRWQWLRKLMDDARNPTLPDRTALLDQASTRLDQEVAASSAPPGPQPPFTPARRAADSILRRPEFRIVASQSWLDRKIAQFWSWFGRLFGATADFGHRFPWLGPVLEWSFVGLTLLTVLIWVRRIMRRQSLAISLHSLLPAADWQKESAQWADLARTEAEASHWREAIHCLFWASIVVLESRRLWRRDYTRTPREYVSLLEPDSPQQLTLRLLTRIFERIWYGLRLAAPEDYTQALALFEDLRRA